MTWPFPTQLPYRQVWNWCNVSVHCPVTVMMCLLFNKLTDMFEHVPHRSRDTVLEIQWAQLLNRDLWDREKWCVWLSIFCRGHITSQGHTVYAIKVSSDAWVTLTPLTVIDLCFMLRNLSLFHVILISHHVVLIQIKNAKLCMVERNSICFLFSCWLLSCW